MSKSYWLKDDEQKGNFSNEKQDTFDPAKGYVGVRLQQGVPLLDRDWNELEDIRRYEDVMLRKHYIGNGSPDNGFNIRATAPPSNDFKILAGRCIVDGFEVVNESSDILYSDQKTWDPPVPDLNPPAANRIDTVYLDVWIEEIRSKDDTDPLRNPQDIKMETCIRHKIEWRVRVDEGSVGHTPPDKHYYYDIAKIHWIGEKIVRAEDLRRTGLKLSGGTIYAEDIILEDGDASKLALRFAYDPDTGLFRPGNNHLYFAAGGKEVMAINPTNVNIGTTSNERVNLRVGGNVGIGIWNPQSKLQVKSLTAVDEGSTPAGAWANFGSNSYFDGAWKRIDTSKAGVNLHMNADDVAGQEFRFARAEADGVLRNIAVIGGQTSYILEGKVGIGTTDPQQKLHLYGIDNPTIMRIQSSAAFGAGRMEFWSDPQGSANEWRPGFIQSTDDGNFTGGLAFFTNGAGVANKTASVEVMRITNGNVGIGTNNPGADRLDVRGRCYSSGGWHTINADYAEYFESVDGSGIPAATSVVLTDDGKVRAAKKGDVPIGIVTTNPAFVGNSYKEWPQKYLRDKFGRLIMEKVKEEKKIPKKKKITKERQKTKKEIITTETPQTEVIFENGKYKQKEKTEKVKREIEVPLFEEVDLYDSTGKTVIGKHRVPIMETYEEKVDVLDENGQPVLIGSGEFDIVERPKLNPKYNEKKKYIPRGERPEWNCIGLLGQLPLRKKNPLAPGWVKVKDLEDDVELWLVK